MLIDVGMMVVFSCIVLWILWALSVGTKVNLESCVINQVAINVKLFNKWSLYAQKRCTMSYKITNWLALWWTIDKLALMHTHKYMHPYLHSRIYKVAIDIIIITYKLYKSITNFGSLNVCHKRSYEMNMDLCIGWRPTFTISIFWDLDQLSMLHQLTRRGLFMLD